MSSEVKSEDSSACSSLKVRRIESRSFSFECDKEWRETGYLPAFAVRILHLISASRRDSLASLFDVNEFLKKVFRFDSLSVVVFEPCLFSSTERFDKAGRAKFRMASLNAGEGRK